MARDSLTEERKSDKDLNERRRGNSALICRRNIQKEETASTKVLRPKESTGVAKRKGQEGRERGYMVELEVREVRR